MMDNVQETSFTDYNVPSLETFRLHAIILFSKELQQPRLLVVFFFCFKDIGRRPVSDFKRMHLLI
jgi:hypothetical protein